MLRFRACKGLRSGFKGLWLWGMVSRSGRQGSERGNGKGKKETVVSLGHTAKRDWTGI